MTDPFRRIAPIVRLAPAKLNLTLAVTGRRLSGYHELHSVMVELDLADRLSLAPSAAGRDSLHTTGFDPGPPAENLVLLAISEARQAVGRGWAAPAGSAGAAPALAARLEKRIPVAAGLAGGSSDAAAAIDGALEAWGAELGPDERLRLALRLGSDVPFFLAGGVALVEGRGERVTRLPPVGGTAPGVLLVTPDVQLSTKDVFAAYAAGPNRGLGGSTHLASDHLAGELRSGLASRDLVLRAGVLAAANDLLGPATAILPQLVPFRRGLARVLGRPIGQSGSGPTCWVLYPSETDAAAAAETVRTAVADGRLGSESGSHPFIAATTIRSALIRSTTEEPSA
ncbi:MAG TPA: hypothetical protein VNF73_03285 [Candidatus Saccharimonadales bacterium]|nr:hypothetical protein [Candidatus Saccharimonadales bacterium]